MYAEVGVVEAAESRVLDKKCYATYSELCTDKFRALKAPVCFH